MEIEGPEFMELAGRGFLMSTQCGLGTWYIYASLSGDERFFVDVERDGIRQTPLPYIGKINASNLHDCNHSLLTILHSLNNLSWLIILWFWPALNGLSLMKHELVDQCVYTRGIQLEYPEMRKMIRCSSLCLLHGRGINDVCIDANPAMLVILCTSSIKDLWHCRCGLWQYVSFNLSLMSDDHAEIMTKI